MPAVAARPSKPRIMVLGLRVVITHHRADCEREQWGPLAKARLRTGERFGIGFAHRPIVGSQALKDTVESRYGIDASMVSRQSIRRAAGGCRSRRGGTS